tara:strand:+ start:1176 stop:1835 length:660 start_codon:yes stop_codon:yes gene_type:complete
MTKEQKRLLSGMLKDYMPDDIDYADIQKFDVNGKAIPISDIKFATESKPKSQDSVHAAADIAEQIKAELKRMLSAMNKEKPTKDEGMLSTAKEKKIAEGYHQMPDGSVMKDEDHKEEVSTDVAKDLDDEGRGLKGYKPPSEPEKRGYKQDDGGNYSVDTTDDYWKTKVGYDAAMDLYATKPAWVKEPSLIYNPKTKKYDPIEKEEFVDLKPKQDLSAFA